MKEGVNQTEIIPAVEWTRYLPSEPPTAPINTDSSGSAQVKPKALELNPLQIIDVHENGSGNQL